MRVTVFRCKECLLKIDYLIIESFGESFHSQFREKTINLSSSVVGLTSNMVLTEPQFRTCNVSNLGNEEKVQ